MPAKCRPQRRIRGGVNNNGAAPITGLRSTGLIGGVPNNQGGNTISVIQPTTIFMTFTQLPVVGNIRVGNQQDWISLEHIESARFLDFMERAPIMDAFFGPNNNGYTPGISMFNMTPNKRAALELGIYKNNVYDSGFPYSVGTNALTYGGRVHCTPYYDEPSDGRYLVHMGIGGEYRTLDTEEAAATNGDNVRVRSRGDIRNASSTLDPNFADTGNFFAKSQGVLCPEMAIVWGPWLFQAEYAASYFNNAATSQRVVAALPGSGVSLGQVFFQGGYLEAAVFPHRRKSSVQPSVRRLQPRRAFRELRRRAGVRLLRLGCLAGRAAIRLARLELGHGQRRQFAKRHGRPELVLESQRPVSDQLCVLLV